MTWFGIEGSKNFVHCAENDEFIVGCHVDECAFDPSHFDPPKVDPNVIGHFFDPYISLNLDDFDIFAGPCSSKSIFYPS